MLPRQIVTPVIRVEESKGKGESYPGDDVDFLSLEMEIFVPRHQGVRLPGRSVTVDDWSWWGRRIVGTVTALNMMAAGEERKINFSILPSQKILHHLPSQLPELPSQFPFLFSVCASHFSAHPTCRRESNPVKTCLQ